eukprot:CAMPEP_0183354260 /NCGR_PEP_ID=MMETSP0164_2-20130417/37207_1 /TAXON_ID=221442 /ORGANISM="Coccolithus pelagicus ssp braarudi, Strain PLY182g" /LENGTH=71 /DNA_ID=CAMNT_0025527113 /DNA_START=55 /DNA_END=266 /DNA_ORIENTATION=-
MTDCNRSAWARVWITLNANAILLCASAPGFILPITLSTITSVDNVKSRSAIWYSDLCVAQIYEGRVLTICT